MLILLSVILGLMVGAVSALLGLGGGVFMVPLMPWIFQFSFIEAVATSLFTVFLVSSFNTLLFARKGLVRWNVGMSMGLPAAAVAFFMGKIAVSTGEHMVKLALLGILCVLAVKTFKGRKKFSEDHVEPLTNRVKAYLSTGGLVSGVISGFTGIGSGLIMTPLMITFRLVKASELSPTSNWSMMITTGSAFMGYVFAGKGAEGLVHYELGLSIAFVAVLSGTYFRPLQQRVSGKAKAVSLSIILIAMILRMLYGVVYG